MCFGKSRYDTTLRQSIDRRLLTRFYIILKKKKKLTIYSNELQRFFFFCFFVYYVLLCRCRNRDEYTVTNTDLLGNSVMGLCYKENRQLSLTPSSRPPRKNLIQNMNSQ